ncbi:50S ribosomal protein L25/general stress protein Ctc [Polaribacter aestuariivivens]|uniref:Large ribosomal subunit protein bL25 n=1 Tax=Polaribacter aestuariivivens TaxID=2304626 RepID=A0A5S3NCA7_9FLAO|nr:50S ribosomal protein L25/general stress protein Ctc [Polaribacter aestuariivivens]TMM30636.1 50S ribosomal protein L25/general stress protein Ctc [Polaribacter aestuariivivens]
MKSITIKGSKRESVGKVATKALRNAGMVPCVIYGGDKPMHFSAPELAFKKLVYTPNVYTATINVDGQEIAAILQDIQFHPVTDRIIHVDFYQLFDDKEVTMNIPVKLTGTSPGVLNGGSLRFTNRKLKVKALPANLPDFISADISKLKIGHKLVITSLFNDDYTFMHPDNTVVVQVRTSRNASADDLGDDEEEETTEEGAAEETTATE